MNHLPGTNDSSQPHQDLAVMEFFAPSYLLAAEPLTEPPVGFGWDGDPESESVVRGLEGVRFAAFLTLRHMRRRYGRTGPKSSGRPSTRGISGWGGAEQLPRRRESNRLMPVSISFLGDNHVGWVPPPVVPIRGNLKDLKH